MVTDIGSDARRGALADLRSPLHLARRASDPH